MTVRPEEWDAPLETLDLDQGEASVERPRLRSWLFFVLVVITAFFGLILSRISLDRSAFVLEELEEEIATAEAQHWDLRLEVARLQDPERIAAAVWEMGFVFPDERRTLDVPRIPEEDIDSEHRWAQLKALLSAQR